MGTRHWLVVFPTGDAPDEDEDMHSDGDIIGDVKGSARRRKLSSVTAHPGSIPFERQWEPDVDAFRPGQVCLLKSASLMRSHSALYFVFSSSPRSVRELRYKLVNDILLCNQNQMRLYQPSVATSPNWLLTCLGQSYLPPLMVPSTPGTAIRPRYLTLSQSGPYVQC
jgi:hypothetical protein